jgi:quercetin dioxygenase-like cupin family protein
MASQIQVADHLSIPGSGSYDSPYCAARGEVTVHSARFRGFSEWVLTADLASGASIEWQPGHGEEAIYVRSGELHLGPAECGPGAALLIESDAPVTIEATSDCQIVHMGTDQAATRQHTSPAPGGHNGGVHLVGADGLPNDEASDAANSGVWYFANGRCPTCRMMFYRVAGHGNTRSHYHTQPQLQHVLDGEIRVGGNTVRAGMTFAIPAGFRYGFVASGDWELVVHRPDLSMMCRNPAEPLIPEGGTYTGPPPWVPVAS